ncbi:hypothetical protein [Aquiflexum sp.]|uniref:hypothetical protein n=1 Tax=Aquiflexum sp. TaxID=1872584 RepID=UPI003593213A
MIKYGNLIIPLLIFSLICIGIQQVNAQDYGIPKISQSFDVALAGGSGNVFSGSVSWNRTHGLFATHKFRLGYGFRFHGLGGSELTYISTPLRLTSQESTIDSLVIARPLTLGISALISIQYHFSPKFHIGFNIDALGVGFGRSGESTFISSSNNGSFPERISASPTGYNVLLGGDNDIGQLKSEMYIGYALNEKFGLRVGFDYTFSEYTTERKLTNDNDRFRYKAPLAFLGLSYFPSKK